MQYTASERTVKKHTTQKAIDIAKRMLGNTPVCLTGVSHTNEMLTTEELNDVVGDIIRNSKYYDRRR